MKELIERLRKQAKLTKRYCPTAEIPTLEENAANAIEKLQAENERLKTVQEHQKQESNLVEIDQVNKWIPVTEMLPENYEAVLTFDGRSIHIMAHHHDFKEPFGIVKGNFMGYAPITHWMPLPEPPKGE